MSPLGQNPKVYHRVYKITPPVPIISQINSIQAIHAYFPKTRLILP